MKSKKLWKELKKHKFRVTIFGSSRMKKSDKEYKEVYKLAKMIGKRGIDLVTGGGPGIMKSASAGHRAGTKKTNVMFTFFNFNYLHSYRMHN